MNTLEKIGLKIGDIVTFASDKESTGGVIYQITMNYESPIAKEKRLSIYETVFHPVSGKKMKPMEVRGYLRIRPIFTFFPTRKGKAPGGADSTLIIYHDELRNLKKIELLDIATKYAELGNIIRDLAVKGGMVSETAQQVDNAHE